jgi:four helix bundle protein
VQFALRGTVAESSLAEAEYFLILSQDLGYVAEEVTPPLFADIEEICRMLNALHQRVLEKLTPNQTSRRSN